jgi:hypothetical protein
MLLRELRTITLPATATVSDGESSIRATIRRSAPGISLDPREG